MELGENRLTISKTLSSLDHDVIEFTEILEDSQIEYVIVRDYVAILTGRSRSTEDIDIILEDLSKADLDHLCDRLTAEGYWGMAMPLDSLTDMFRGGDRFRVAKRDEMYPNSTFGLPPTKSSVRRSQQRSRYRSTGTNSLSARSSCRSPTSSNSLRDGGSMEWKDFEDALHLYLRFEGRFKEERLESYIDQLGGE